MKTTWFKGLVVGFCLCLLLPFPSCKKKSQDGGIQTDTKTYSNEYFTFRYPKDWFLSDQPNQISVNGPEEFGYYVNCKIDYNAEVGMTLEDFQVTVETQNNLHTLPEFKDLGEMDISIGDQPAIQHTILTTIQTLKSPLVLYVKLTYLVKNSNLGVVITAEIPQAVYNKYENQITQVIQSFRFK